MGLLLFLNELIIFKPSALTYKTVNTNRYNAHSKSFIHSLNTAKAIKCFVTKHVRTPGLTQVWTGTHLLSRFSGTVSVIVWWVEQDGSSGETEKCLDSVYILKVKLTEIADGPHVDLKESRITPWFWSGQPEG